jgi:outer membrane lipopolysaccharide assembly protein LptE/RlpB
MKKIILLFCFWFTFGCSGYQPIFSSKDSTFYIEGLESLNNDKIAYQINSRLSGYKIKDVNKKNYNLKISSKKNIEVISRDSKGNSQLYKMIIKVSVTVISDQKIIKKMDLNESFNYSNNENKFSLNQYKKEIEENLISKISEELILRLQIL